MPLEPFIPIAVWYTGGRARATMVRPPDADSPRAWRRDLLAIKECGFNSVRCWVDWASAEPAPGRYDFRTLDLLLELASEVGLRVICQLYLDSAPDWLATQYPDCRYVSAGGVAVDSQGAPGYCYDNPGVHGAAERFMHALGARVANHPAFYAWDLWSEPHIVQWGYFDYLPQPAVFCYCHHTVQRFRDWLRARYGDIEALNRAWYRTFSSWDVIPAPKFISLMTYTEYIDWIEFIMDKLAQDLRWRHDTIRTVDQHVTTSHSAVPSVLTLPLDEQGSPDDWRMPPSVDIWGTSLYPKHVGARETNDPSFRAAMLASTRSACAAHGAPYWLGELQAGHGYVGMFASHMTATDARHYIWHPLAHAAKGLCFYAWHPMSSGYESGGFGMAHLDGSPSDRALAAGEAARVVEQNQELFFRAQPVAAQAAVCWNVNANIMWLCMREKRHYVPSRCYIGAYRALFEQHLPADYVHPQQISSGGLSRYKLLALPFAFMLPRAAAAALAQWVEQGGVVLAEARTAWNDETGYCGEAIPGFGLEQVFGCREAGAQGMPEDEPVRMRIVRAHPALPLLKEGDVLAGAAFKQVLEPRGGEVVAVFEDGQPAIVANRYGAGWAVFAGALLSYGFYKFGRSSAEGANAGRLLQGLAQVAGLEGPVAIEAEAPQQIEAQVSAGRLESGEEYRLLYVFNHADHAQPATLHMAGSAPGAATDLMSGAPVPLHAGALALEMEPHGIRVLRLDGATDS